MTKSYRDLIVWQKAHGLARTVLRATKDYLCAGKYRRGLRREQRKGVPELADHRMT